MLAFVLLLATQTSLIVPAQISKPGESKPMDWRKLLTKETFQANGMSLPYRLLRPAKEEKGTTYPLVIFLHGAGERGTENETPIVHGVKEFATPGARKDFPCFLIAPQCPDGKRWVEVDWSLRSHEMPKDPSEPEALLLKLLHSLEQSHPIDKSRIYVTGLSMGGYGVWDLISRYPNRFAAAVPVCGGGDESQGIQAAKIPVWAFHGAKDGVVIPERSRNMIEALKKAGANPKYTEYADVGHDAWNRAYADPAMMRWLFSQKQEK